MGHFERKRIKVCHMSSVHGQEDTRIFHKECVSLARGGFEVYQITKGETYCKSNVHLMGIEGTCGSIIGRMINTTEAVYEKVKEINADIYHAHDPELLPILLKLKKVGKKVIFDSHEYVVGTIHEKEYIPLMFRSLVGTVYEFYQTYACKMLDAVVTATPNVTEYFKGIGINRVIDLCNFPILNDDFVPPCYDGQIAVFAGGISAQWNHECIIDAIERIDNIKYVLCGGSDKQYLERLKSHPGWAKVEYKGKIPHEQVAEVLQRATVGFALLTPGENTDGTNGNMANTKIFEEMAAGLPVICTEFTRWKDFVETYDCGICVRPNDVAQIVSAVEQLVHSPGMAEAKGRNGRRLVEEKFNWAREEQKLLALYDEIGSEIIYG